MENIIKLTEQIAFHERTIESAKEKLQQELSALTPEELAVLHREIETRAHNLELL
jgi:hypothetical protein